MHPSVERCALEPLRDSDSDVRQAVARALVEIRDPRGVDALRDNQQAVVGKYQREIIEAPCMAMVDYNTDSQSANQGQNTPEKPLAGRKEEVHPAEERPLKTNRPDTQPATFGTPPEYYDVFLSYSHMDAVWVEHLAKRLEDEHSLRIWLDKWVLIPGQPWQQVMAHTIDQAKCCVVCISEHTPGGWFKQ